MKHILLIVIAAFALSACHVGPQIHKLPSAREPAGADVLITVRKTPSADRQRYRGELLEVSDAGVTVFLPDATTGGSTMTFVDWSVVHEIVALQLPGVKARLWLGATTVDDAIERLGVVSRFPQGLSADIRARLLASQNQTAIDVIDKNSR